VAETSIVPCSIAAVLFLVSFGQSINFSVGNILVV